MKKNKLLIFLLIYIIAISLFSVSFFKLESDYLWHIKVGEYMLKHGIIRHDIFSWFVRGKYWMSHEWLFEIIIYSLKCIFGRFHIFIYCYSCILGLLFILLFGNKDNIFKNILFTLLWFSFSVIIVFSVQARPHLLSNCLLALSIWFLYDLYKNENSKLIYFLPLINIIWANVHGGSSNLVYILCFIFLVFGLFNFKFSKIEAKRISKLQVKKYFIVMILCMIAVCINIHGFRMFIYPYQNMADSTMINNILEWRSTSLNEASHYIYFALILIVFFIMLFSKKKIQFIDLILFGFCVFLGLKSIRFWYFTYIISTFLIFNYVSHRDYDESVEIGIIILSVLFSLIFVLNFKTIFNKCYFMLDDKDITFIKNINPDRIFNMYNYGGDLIYNDVDVFIDGRADLYTNYNYKDYLMITKLEGDYVQLIKKYNFDYFLVDANYPINTYLKYNDNYELLYINGDVRIYKKMN